MKSHASLRITFTDDEVATAVAESVRLDDQGFIRTQRRGATITAEASADSPLSLLHTLDDYLACLSVAERTAEAARPRARTRRRRA
jgi:hypothetical protein